MSSSTYTSMSIGTILPKDETYRIAKKTIYHKSESSGNFAESFFHFKKQYRKRYTEKYIKTNGFEVENKLAHTDVDNNLLDMYIRFLYLGEPTSDTYSNDCLLDVLDYNDVKHDLLLKDFSSTVMRQGDYTFGGHYTKIVPLEEISLFYLQVNEQPRWNLETKHYTITKDAPKYEEEIDSSGQPTGKLIKVLDSDGNEIIESQEIEYNKYLFAFKHNPSPFLPDDSSHIDIFFFKLEALPDGFDYSIDSINQLDEFQLHKIEITNHYLGKVLVVNFTIDGVDYIHIFHNSPKRYIDFFLKKRGETLLQPIVVLKYDGQLRTDNEAVKKILKDYGLKDEKISESLSRKNEQTNEDVIKSAAITNSVEIADIYKYKPGNYSSQLVSSFPTRLSRRMEVSSDGTYYTLTQEVADWWYNLNRYKAYMYIDFLYNLISNYYDSGEYEMIWDSPNNKDIKYLTTIERSVKIINGVILDSRRSDGSINKEYGELTEENGKTYIRRQFSEVAYGEIEITKITQNIYVGNEWFVFESDGGWLSSSDADGQDRCSFRDVEDASNNGGYYRTPDFIIETNNSSKAGDNTYVCFKTRPRLLVPVDIVNDMSFLQYTIVFEYGLTLMTYSEYTEEKDFTKDILLIVGTIATCMFLPQFCAVATDYTVNYFSAKMMQYALTNILTEITNDRQLASIYASALTAISMNYANTGELVNMQNALTVTKAIYNFELLKSQREEFADEYLESLSEKSKNIEDNIEEYNTQLTRSHILAPSNISPQDYFNIFLNGIYSFSSYLNTETNISDLSSKNGSKI